MILPLGEDCTACFGLKHANLRACSYPFDWISCTVSKRIELLYKVLQFTKEEELTEFIDELFEIQGNEVYVQQYSQKTRLKNLKYEIDFAHDDLDDIKDKYTRRFKRLINDIKTSTDITLFCVSMYKKYNKELTELCKYFNEKFGNTKLISINAIDTDYQTDEKVIKLDFHVPHSAREQFENNDFSYHQGIFRDNVKACCYDNRHLF